MIEVARSRFPFLLIPESVIENHKLVREPFNGVICQRAIVLLGILNTYMEARLPAGAEGTVGREIIANHFSGERAAFTGESPSNQNTFARELTFLDPQNSSREIFAHWHGKISHRYFRLHFEWPVPASQPKLKVLYLGPKITKA